MSSPSPQEPVAELRDRTRFQNTPCYQHGPSVVYDSLGSLRQEKAEKLEIPILNESCRKETLKTGEIPPPRDKA